MGITGMTTYIKLRRSRHEVVVMTPRQAERMKTGTWLSKLEDYKASTQQQASWGETYRKLQDLEHQRELKKIQEDWL